MSELEGKSNNDIQLVIKQLELEHKSLKDSMIKDYDIIEALKQKMKKEMVRLSEVEKLFDEAQTIIVGRLKGNI